ncbi:MAG: hypothetical protein JW889_13390 [Verrucomicrobia bacterium]|nr:hypothetical protein [Verrucomicrobiota bacterium]
MQLTYTYDKVGNRLTKKYDNDAGRVETYRVNGYNQLTAVEGTARAYTNVCGLIDEANVAAVTVENLTAETEAARVDLAHGFFIGRKLELQSGSNSIEVTAVDKAGNSTTVPVSPETHTITQNEDIDVQFEYDVRGNMVLKEVWNGASYDVKERYFYTGDNLIEYIWYASGENDGKHPHFVYDGLSRRVRVEYGTVTLDGEAFDYFTTATTKEYAFLGTQPVAEYDYNAGTQARTLVRQYYWGLDIVAGIGGLLYQVAFNSPAEYYYHHYDGSGNVTAITDADKAVVAYTHHAPRQPRAGQDLTPPRGGTPERRHRD